MKARHCRRRALSLQIVLFLVVCAAGSKALAADPSTQELLERIQALEERVEQLRTGRLENQGQGPLVDAAVSRAVQEARANQGLSGPGITAGYTPTRGFVIRSEDENFLIHPWLLLQFRNVTNYRENGKREGTESDTESGFEVRRMKVGLDGNLFSKDTTFQIIWSTSRKTGAVSLDDAWIRYHFPETPFAVRAGQIRDPFDHEQLSYGVYEMTVERSLIDSLFADGEGLVQGVGLAFDSDNFRSEVAFSDGMRTGNTNFRDYPTTNSNWGISGRAEFKLLGDWKQYADFSAYGDERPLLVAGAGFDYTEAGITGVFSHVLDVQFEHPSGFSCYAAYLGRYTNHNRQIAGNTSTTNTIDTYDSTLRLQAAYVFDQRWEPFIRYEYIHFEGRELALSVSTSTIHEITAGVNYFIVQHRVKVSADVVYLPNGCPVSDDGSGILASPRGQEVVLRAQLQIWR